MQRHAITTNHYAISEMKVGKRETLQPFVMRKKGVTAIYYAACQTKVSNNSQYPEASISNITKRGNNLCKKRNKSNLKNNK